MRLDNAKVDEGLLLEFSPLLSLDGRVIDATIKCDADQVEKMITVPLDVPTSSGVRQRAQFEVPQIARSRLHERFRWPADQVLLVSLGMVAIPPPPESRSLISGLPFSLGSDGRAELLVFVENQGDLGAAVHTAVRTNDLDSGPPRRRY